VAEQPTSPVERLIELLVYAPVGLALAARDDLPRMVDKGRERVGSQILLARTVGRLAVTHGARQAGRWVDQAFGANATAPATGPVEHNGSQVAESAARVVRPSAPASGVDPARDDGLPVEELAIPGYDSLAAPQVVQRLGGLSAGERDAVRRYEEAHRGRRTILSKITQLESEPD
jgi:hypothetical protein